MIDYALTGKVALVTGASRGIGQGIACALAKQGAIVVGTATTDEGAKRITQLFQDQQWAGGGMMLNVCSPEAVNALVQAIKEKYGPVSILVNNAAINKDDLFLRMKEEAWLDVLETDLTSIFRVSKACIR